MRWFHGLKHIRQRLLYLSESIVTPKQKNKNGYFFHVSGIMLSRKVYKQPFQNVFQKPYWLKQIRKMSEQFPWIVIYQKLRGNTF